MCSPRLGLFPESTNILQLILVIAMAFMTTNAMAVELVMEFGGSGSADGEFNEINGIAVSSDGMIYVVDANNGRVQVFNPDGGFAFSFGEPGVGAGEFDLGMCGIVINENLELLYVSEGLPGSANHRVQAFDLNGNFSFEFGGEGTAAGQFDSPCQMALGEENDLFVVDRGNDRVQVFSSLGGFIREFGTSGTGDGEFNLPSGIAIDLGGQVFVADSFSPRIQVFDFSGAFLKAFGEGGTGAGQLSRPCHLAQGGTLMVADALNERVQVFTLDGHFQLEFPISGTEQSIFCSLVPTAIATDRLGRIYVEEGDFVRVYSIDRDGDGLLDLWETSGIDADADGVVDLPIHLPPYNADPDHKDLFLELDWDPATPVTSNVVREMKATLCAAPVYAGGVDNPDGEPGIRLHVDTGTLTDPLENENSRIPCSCRDGLDNNGDGVFDSTDPACFVLDPSGGEGGAGLVTCDDELDNDGDGAIDRDDSDCPTIYDEFAFEDSPSPPNCADGLDNDGDGATDDNDPDCAVGDDLGGGSVLTDPGGAPFSGAICDFGPDFYNAKASNFDPVRALVFRYVIQTPKCDRDGDGELDSRSKAEVGGNDIFYSTPDPSLLPPGARLSAASWVHELGHNLNLTHGGQDSNNCEPNYVSIMNYDHGFGIDSVIRGVSPGMYDYSPVRFPGGRGSAPLPASDINGELNEADLDERMVMDPTDALHLFTFVNALGQKVRSPLNGDVDGDGTIDGTDWDGDGVVTDAAGLSINLDTVSPEDRPPECFNSDIEILTGHNDWLNMSLPFLQFGDQSDAPLNATVTPEPTLEELVEYRHELNTTDLSVQLEDDGIPVEAGSDITITVTSDNLGPNPAERVSIVLDPGGVPLLIPPACEEAAGLTNCEFGPLSSGAAAVLPFTIGQEDACSDGLPNPIEVSAMVENASEYAGPDPHPGNNSALLLVEPTDTSPPVIDCNTPLSVSPNDAPLSVMPVIEDSCDESATATLSAVQCYRINPNGERKKLPCRVETAGDTIEIWRTGGAGSHIEWTVDAVDASGNSSRAQCRLVVEKPMPK